MTTMLAKELALKPELTTAPVLQRSGLLGYGLFGFPLALVALPIYVYLPQFYSLRFDLSLAAIGSVLLLTRLADAMFDPLLGIWIDSPVLDNQTAQAEAVIGAAGLRYVRPLLLALPLLIAGFIGLFHPPAFAVAGPLLWFCAASLVVYFGFSLATIAYQSWGAALSRQIGQRTRVTAARESCGLLGVITAAALPGTLGLAALSWVFVFSLMAGAIILLASAPRPALTILPPAETDDAAAVALSLNGQTLWMRLSRPLRNRRFRWLFSIFIVNGIAAAIPATLFLFFAEDKLRLGQYAGLFLVLYFAAAALSMPLWSALAKRRGEAHAWLCGMLLAIAAFAWAYTLGPGQMMAFAAICIVSGAAFGADLALPAALLTAVIGTAGDGGRREASYFGLWNWASKINLALAAGIALPLLQALGYQQGSSSEGSAGMQALSLSYAVLPCILKLIAAGLLWRAPLRDI